MRNKYLIYNFQSMYIYIFLNVLNSLKFKQTCIFFKRLLISDKYLRNEYDSVSDCVSNIYSFSVLFFYIIEFFSFNHFFLTDNSTIN